LMPRIMELQDNVRIDHASGTAADGGKYDAEIAPQGLRFRIEIACVHREGDAGNVDGDRALGFVLAAFETGRVRLGGDVTCGLGVVRPVAGSISHECHDLGTTAGLVAARVMPGRIDDSLSINSGLSASQLPARRQVSGMVSGEVRLRLRADGPILVGGSQRPRPPGQDSSSADLLFGHTLVADYARREFVSRPWIPGSSLKGVLRHRVMHVLEAIGRSDREAVVDSWFGAVGDLGASISRITIYGQLLADEKPTVVQHVAIDRLTGGSLPGALFAEAPIWRDGLEVTLTIEVNQLPFAGAAALAHAVIDLGTGDLPVGGGVNRGNGRLSFAKESDPTNSLQGHGICFDVHVGEQRYLHTDTPDRLLELLTTFDTAAGTG